MKELNISQIQKYQALEIFTKGLGVELYVMPLFSLVG